MTRRRSPRPRPDVAVAFRSEADAVIKELLHALDGQRVPASIAVIALTRLLIQAIDHLCEDTETPQQSLMARSAVASIAAMFQDLADRVALMPPPPSRPQ